LDYWIELSSGKIVKITRGNRYLIGESLEEAIANIESGGENTKRKVISVNGIPRKQE